jgi:hypothetical protein
MKKKVIFASVALLALLVAAAFYLTRSELIEVDGYSVEISVKGEGGPTIVLESGFTGERLLWLFTQYRLASHATTLAYERAGIGKSSPRPESRTASQMADELHALLKEVGVPPPYVLVGHSAGGMYMKLFASKYPELVGGLVFIDPATEEMYERWQSSEQNGWLGIEAKLREIGATEGTLGQLRAMPQSIEEAKNVQLPSVPTTIITATNPSSSPLETEEDMEFWLETHKHLAESITGSRHVIYDDRNHINILFDGRIIDEILAVVNHVE